VTGQNTVKTEADHPDSVIGVVALMRSLGTTDFDFYNGLINQLLNASTEGEASESELMLSVIEPRDQVEAMLASQMAAVNRLDDIRPPHLKSACHPGGYKIELPARRVFPHPVESGIRDVSADMQEVEGVTG
jgi:hypothetical protein